MDHRRNNAQDVLRCHLCETQAPPMYCDICNLNLCKPCVGEHLSNESTEHKVVPFRKRGSTLYCSKHSTKLCDLHCEQCDIPICVQCVSSGEHIGHKQNDILIFLEKKNKGLQKDLKELVNLIKPKYQESASNISVQKSDLRKNSKKLKTALDKQGESLHREIDNAIKKLKNEVDELESKDLLGDLRQRLKQKDEEIAYYKEQQQHHISDLTKQHQQQRKELLQQLDCLQHELQQTKDEQTKAYTSDVQSLRSQVLILISQVTESQNKLEAAKDALEKKSGRLQELEHISTIQREEFQRQRAQDAGLVETLRLSLMRYENALNAERKEHQNTKKTSVELRQSFNQLVSDHKNLSEKYDNVRMQEQSGCTETEKQKLLDQIGRLTARVYAGEEAINYREEKLKKVEEENKKIKEKLNNVVPVLRAQGEVWKSNFDAERDFRKRLHAEKSQLENKLKQLQFRNQQLLDEMENFSKRQFQEMQQRHTNQGFQHSLQQHLRVGQQNHGSPYQPPTYPTQSYPGPAAGAGAVYDNRSTNMTMGQSHGGSQKGEELQQFECPKCNQTCPDMDTLQIHVLDCIDQDMT
ncbi:NF-kappa-B essential modulator-like [Crassostrea angulata]|uniref:NF-kappa-B essential modulator-like n=1 Tax=Magallana angulata TaxID=2784310 RepID=UPI0022B1D615|nr:NF-kappa-B essential modulator-like [Crassostrea angulata]XP_052678740.1 NF-kappa-B essential modulator-like [Crassostrea angulata]